MEIGARIKQLRKMELLTQQGFAERLGIERSYISMLEKGKHKPSEQLILSICRAFRVRIEWLKEGKGEMFDTTPVFTAKGQAMLEEITRRLISNEKQVPVGLIAELLGVDVDNFPEEREKIIRFDDSILFAVRALMAVYREGSKKKIDAILHLLKALYPEKQDILLEEQTKKKA